MCRKDVLYIVRLYATISEQAFVGGMQLPEKYKENFDVSSEGPPSGVTPSLEFLEIILMYFWYSCIPTNESLFILLTLPTLAQTVQVVYTTI